jgi:hypothetical protein
MKFLAVGSLLFLVLAASAPACELCAIYSADSARSESSSGLLFTVAEQFVSSHTILAEGESFSTAAFLQAAYLDSSITHLVPGYNFSRRFGVSLNMPLEYLRFHRVELASTGAIVDEAGTVSGLGDVALIGRLSLIQINKMKYSATVNLLAGVKFPTGDTARLQDEINAAKIDQALFGSNHQHGTLGGIHQHDLTQGSGSYDGVFGLASAIRWRRWFLNNQVQYYLRTEGELYQFGNQIIVSGGPGGYFLLNEKYTLNLQANAFYESSGRDKILGQTFNQTGMTSWYLGPLLNFTLGEHFSANAGVDVPLRIYNHGIQSVPDYRVHAGFTWRF